MSRKKRSNKNDPFGFDFDLGLDSYAKRATLANNRFRGKMAEDSFALEQIIQGNDCRKIHKGGDFVVQKRDIFGRKVGKPKTYEIKTGNAKLSPARKKRSKKGSYEVVRDFQRGFQTHQIAFSAQAETQGALPLSGLHGEHAYLMFLRCCSVTAATVLSSKSINISTSSRADWGHTFTHLAQPLHFSASITM